MLLHELTYGLLVFCLQLFIVCPWFFFFFFFSADKVEPVVQTSAASGPDRSSEILEPS